MGASGRWFKALMGVKKLNRTTSVDSKDEHRRSSHEKSRRWGLFRHSSDKKRSLDISCQEGDSFEALKNDGLHNAEEENGDGGQYFKSLQDLREEWAATRIQTAFRGFLSRRALKALKGLVRLQALVRGHQVRRQAAMTLRCMQALVRVQAHVRARRVRMSEEGLAVQQKVNERRLLEAHLQDSEKGWCDSHGTVEEIQARLQQKQEGAIKRDRALAYAFSHQWRPKSHLNDPTSMGYEPDTSHWGWTWLERWMAARPWENRSKELLPKAADTTSSRSYDHGMEMRRAAMERSQVKVRRNKVSVRVMPPRYTCSGPLYSSSTQVVLQSTPRSSTLSSDVHDGSSPSSSSKGTTPTSHGVTSGLSSSCAGQLTPPLPSYMAATQSAKAKIKVPQRIKPSFHDLNLKSSYNLSECGVDA